MSLVAAVICPEAPVLMPGLSGAIDPVPQLRDACRAGVEWLLEQPLNQVVVIAGWPVSEDYSSDAPSGIERFRSGQVPAGALPTGLELAREWLTDAGWRTPGDLQARFGEARAGEVAFHGPVRFRSVDSAAALPECLELGATLADGPPTGLIVMADGSATRTDKAPGHFDERAAAFDAELVEALRHPDPGALAALEADVCDALWMRGRAALQVLAGAALAAGVSHWRGDILLDDAPFGVQYVVASWQVPSLA